MINGFLHKLRHEEKRKSWKTSKEEKSENEKRGLREKEGEKTSARIKKKRGKTKISRNRKARRRKTKWKLLKQRGRTARWNWKGEIIISVWHEVECPFKHKANNNIQIDVRKKNVLEKCIYRKQHHPNPSTIKPLPKRTIPETLWWLQLIKTQGM